jgi:hypothetical protein
MQGTQPELPEDLKPWADAIRHGYEHAHVIEIKTKQDMSRFARAHEAGPVTWETQDGPGGTIIVIEHEDGDGQAV